MTMPNFYDFLNEVLSEEEKPLVVPALRQDSFVFSQLQTPASVEKLIANQDLISSRHTPGYFALAATFPEYLTETGRIDKATPAVLERFIGVYEAFKQNGVEADSLGTAVEVALALMEKRKIVSHWKLVLNDIFKNRHAPAEKDASRSWKTPLMLASQLDAHGSEILESLSQAEASQMQQMIFIHCVLAKPMPVNEKVNMLAEALANHVETRQIEALKLIQIHAGDQMMKSTAKAMLSSRNLPQAITSKASDVWANPAAMLQQAVRMQNTAIIAQMAGETDSALSFVKSAQDAVSKFMTGLSLQKVDLLTHMGAVDESAALVNEVVKENPDDQEVLDELMLAVNPSLMDQQVNDLSKMKRPLSGLLQAKSIENVGNMPLAKETAENAIKDLASDDEVLASASQPRFSQNSSLEKLFDESLHFDLDSKATHFAEKILASNPSNIEIIQKSAPLLYKAGNYDQALDHFQTLLLLDPTSIEHQRMKALCLESMGRDQEAFETWNALTDRTDEDALHLAHTAVRMGKMNAAIEAASAIPEGSVHYGKSLVTLGKVYRQLGDTDQAIQYLSKAIDVEVDEEEPWIALADLYKSNGDVDRSIETLKAARSVFPQSEEVMLQLSRNLLTKESPSEALTVLTELTSKNPEFLPGQILTVQTMKSLHHEGTERKMDELVSLFPDSPEVKFLKGQWYLDSGFRNEARQFLQEAVASNKADPEWLVAYADALAGKDYQNCGLTKNVSTMDAQIARENLKKSGLIGSDPLAASVQAEMLLEDQNAEEAFRVLADAESKQVSPESMWYWRLQAGMARAATMLGKLDMALASIQEAINHRPGLAGLYQILAEVHQASGDTLAAVDAANQVLVIAPDVAGNILWFANFLTKLGHQEDAEKELQKAITRKPDEFQFRLALAELLAGSNKTDELKKTLGNVHALIHAQASEEELVRAAGLYLKMGDFNSAETVLTKRFERFPDSEKAQLDLSGMLARNGKVDKALEVLDKDAVKSARMPLDVIKAEIFYERSDFSKANDLVKSLINPIGKESTRLQSEFAPDSWNELLNETDPVLCMKTKVNFASGNFTDAVTSANEWKTANPANVWAEFYLQQAALASGNRPQKLAHAIESNLPGIIAFSRAQESIDSDEVGRAMDLINQIGPEIDVEWVGAIKAQAASARGELIEADVNAGDFDLSAAKTGKWVKAEDIVRIRSLIKAAAARWHWNDALEMAANLYHANTGNIANSVLFLEVIVEAEETLKDTSELGIKIHKPAYNLMEQSKQDYSIIVDALSNTNSEEAKHWLLRGKLVYEPNQTNTRALALIAPRPDDIVAMMRALHVMGEDETAIQVGHKFESHPRVLAMQAKCLAVSDRKKALTELEHSLQISEGQPEVWAARAALEEQLGQKENAVQSIENALSYWPDEVEWHIQAARLWQSAGDVKKAIGHLKIASEQESEDPELKYQIGKMYLSLGKTSEAIQILEEASKTEVNRSDIMESLAEAYHQAGDLEKSVKTAEKAALANPFTVKPILLTGEIELEKGNTSRALEYARQAISRNEKNAEAITFLAKVLIRKGEKTQALAALEKAATSEEATLDLMLKHAHLVREIKGSAESKGIFEDLVKKYPQNLELLRLLAESQMDCGEKTAAEETARHSLRLDADQPEVHAFLGKLKLENGNLDQAVYHFSQQVALDQKNVQGYLDLARVYSQQREFHRALDTLQQAISVQPQDSRPYMAAAILLKDAKDYASAEVMLRKASVIDPNDVNIKRQLGAVIALNLIHKSQQESSQL